MYFFIWINVYILHFVCRCSLISQQNNNISANALFVLLTQMKKVEEDLVHSKSLRENQAKEFSQQLDALREKYEQQVWNFLFLLS